MATTPTGAILLKGRNALPIHYLFKIESFSLLSKASVAKFCSDVFEAGSYKWNISLYPNGNGEGRDNSISIILDVSDSSFSPDLKLFVKFILRVKNQTKGKYIKFRGEYLYGLSNANSWGWRKFLQLAKLKDLKLGYVVDDTLIIEAEATLLGLVFTRS